MAMIFMGKGYRDERLATSSEEEICYWCGLFQEPQEIDSGENSLMSMKEGNILVFPNR